jgi:NhaA family Na+:H+ antiporter
VAAKVLLVAFSIIDDIVAVIIIAVAYTQGITWDALGYAAGLALLMLAGNRLGIRTLFFYLTLGLFLWFFILKSGVHATVAGILVGLLIPMRQGRGATSVGEQLERRIHPWVSFLIIPLFVFVNGGVHFSGVSLSTFTHPTALGIILGLALGKGLGVFLAARLAIALRLAVLPSAVSGQVLLATGCLSGIGFTMSFFFANLAFDTPSYLLIAKQAILLGSALACLLGVWLFISAHQLGNKQR